MRTRLGGIRSGADYEDEVRMRMTYLGPGHSLQVIHSQSVSVRKHAAGVSES